MIDTTALLPALQKMVRTLHADLLARSSEVADVAARLKQLHAARQKEQRSAQSYEAWRDEFLTQVAVAWVLGCVFVRYLEDNGFLGDHFLAGPTPKAHEQARHNFDTFLHRTRTPDTEREYLLDVFRRTQELDAVKDLFAPGKTALWAVEPSNAAAIALLDFFQHQDPRANEHIPEWRFATEQGDTRFLGDLYQDLSEDIREKYALLQTPLFVEEFILDRTLEPAIREFGFEAVRLIDPTCGSGHFLLGAFARLFRRWEGHWQQTGSLDDTNPRTLAQRALDQVYGVDLNPYAVAICRFRLVIAAMTASGLSDIARAPAWKVNVTVGDTLIHGKRFTREVQRGLTDHAGRDLLDPYELEDTRELNRILGQQYHAVVGNPPYITVKDSVISKRYKDMYATCYKHYHLSSPFTERFFDLGLPAHGGTPPGHVGLIMDDAFMKRDFGKALVEYLQDVDLTHVVGVQNVPIPGNGTPSVILIGRPRKPVEPIVRAVLGIKGEFPVPEVPHEGRVWQSILAMVDTPSENEFISVVDLPRTRLAVHPWSMGGGGAADLKELIDEKRIQPLAALATEIGFGAVTRCDQAYWVSKEVAHRHGILPDHIRPLVTGDNVRDWCVFDAVAAIWPYNQNTLEAEATAEILHFIWPYRAELRERVAYGQSQLERGLKWYEYSMFFAERYRRPFSIAFSCMSTHNNFVFDRGGQLFNRHAPIIKLRSILDEDLHVGLLGLLNSSAAGFWMRQVFFPRGGDQVAGGKARVRKSWWETYFEFAATGMGDFPIPEQVPDELPAKLDTLAQRYGCLLPSIVVRQGTPSRAALDAARDQAEAIRRQMIYLQEELDWQVYHLYGLTAEPLTYTDELQPINHGERAFEIIMARKGLEAAWFQRHGSVPIVELPNHWPADYKRLVDQRIRLIESDKNIGLIERPEFKRRWSLPKPNKPFREVWQELERDALRGWLLDRLETERYWPRPRAGQPSPAVLQSGRGLADLARTDAEFLQVGELYTGSKTFDVEALVTELVLGESVPFLPALRYTPSGEIKRAVWERVWEQQRAEDRGEKVKVEVPPGYKKDDFLSPDSWRLRDELDVPKERWVSYPPLAEPRADGGPSPVVAWAGYGHLDRAMALAAYYDLRKERDAGSTAWIEPLLAGLVDLLPWLKQWHNVPDPAYGNEKMGDYFEKVVLPGALQEQQLTLERVAAWRPAAPPPKARKAPRPRQKS